MWNVGVQMALPWSSSLDVSYVGTHGYNILAYGSSGLTTVESALDLNAPDLGAAYLPQNQDPTLAASAIPGATALRTDLLRPYRGIGTIYSSWPPILDAVRLDPDLLQPAVQPRLAGGTELDVEPAFDRQYELAAALRSQRRMAPSPTIRISRSSTSC